jgi:hypothetical protein
VATTTLLPPSLDLDASEAIPASKRTRISWSPQPRQARFISCPAQEIFFGGSRGGGKTDGVIGHFYARAMRWGPAAKGLVLRRTLKGLRAFERRAKEIYGSIFSVKDHYNETEKMWTFPNGATLILNYCDTDADVLQYQGHDYSFVYPEELTQWPSQETYEWLFTINRSPVVGDQCQVVSTGNPGGPGMEWVKKRFIDFAPADRISTIKFQDPRDPQRYLTRTRVFIPSSLHDNIYLKNTGYEAALLSLPERMRLMYLDGRWDVVDGAFFDEWNPEVHICRAFNPPPDWKRWFSFDWGYDAPYAGLWWCESPAGKVYIYREIYGLDPEKAEKGNFKGSREGAREVAQRIRQIESRTQEHIIERWVDGSIFDNDGNEASIGTLFEREGVFFQKAAKRNKAGGIQMFRDYLRVVNGISRLQIMDNCRHLIRTLPNLQVDPHNPELYLSKGGVEDHLGDCCYMGARKDLPTQEERRMLVTNRPARRGWGKGGWR